MYINSLHNHYFLNHVFMRYINYYVYLLLKSFSRDLPHYCTNIGKRVFILFYSQPHNLLMKKSKRLITLATAEFKRSRKIPQQFSPAFSCASGASNISRRRAQYFFTLSFNRQTLVTCKAFILFFLSRRGAARRRG